MLTHFTPLACPSAHSVHDFFMPFMVLNALEISRVFILWHDAAHGTTTVNVNHWWDVELTKDTPSLRWRHNVHDGVSNHQPHDCLLNRLFRHRSKKTSKLRVTGLCAGNSPGTGEFPAQMASNTENVSIWWRHHDISPSWASYKPRNLKNTLYQSFVLTGEKRSSSMLYSVG